MRPEVNLDRPFREPGGLEQRRTAADPSLTQVVESTAAVEGNLGLLHSRDSIDAYMYRPPLQKHFDASVACLFRPSLGSDESSPTAAPESSRCTRGRTDS